MSAFITDVVSAKLAFIAAYFLFATFLVLLAIWIAGVRYIPHHRVGIVEKLWSSRGSLSDGRIVALDGEAGFQADLLRGGLHFGYRPLQYRIHREPLVSIGEGQIGYVYSRDGSSLPPVQTLGRVVSCNNFQDARAFLASGGQRGRQRAILREGTYAINQALFVVIAPDAVYAGPIRDGDLEKYASWQAEMERHRGFDPVVVGAGHAEAGKAPIDDLGIVTLHDGQPIEPGEIIAPAVNGEGQSHGYFQDPEKFLALGGRRGKQLQVLTDGTFFINRWFATVDMVPKTVIPIGYVGVVVSYYGVSGKDLTGDQFRYGEQVEPGHRGVWKRPLPPGKYPLNPFAQKVELVPTVNFVLRWITGITEEHQYDKDLRSIALITADGYEPSLPLSLVLHIDYEKAPRVVQRFGDVKRLISQTLDPIISAYFRDVAQSTHMLDLLTKREDIQQRATDELGRRFAAYDINCVAVLIGRPETQWDKSKEDHDPIDSLFNQLRIRRLAAEQVETFARQQAAAEKLRELNQAQAAAAKQTELTQTAIEVEISGNRGEAELALAQRLAERDVARASGESRSRELIGHGEASRIGQTGLAEAAVFLKKIRAYGDPRLFAVSLVSDAMARSQQPLVPERLLVMDGNGKPGGLGLFGQMLTLLMAERAGIDVAADTPEAREVLASLEKAAGEIDAKSDVPSAAAA